MEATLCKLVDADFIFILVWALSAGGVLGIVYGIKLALRLEQRIINLEEKIINLENKIYKEEKKIEKEEEKIEKKTKK